MEVIMWTRKELKQKAKEAFKRNYWKTVLVSLLFTMLVGGGAFSSAGSSSSGTAMSGTELTGISTDAGEDGSLAEEMPDVAALIENMSGGELAAFGVIAFAVFITVFLIILAIGLLVNAFLINPVEVGVRNFMLRNLQDTAEVKEIAYGFDHSYKSLVKTMFFRDLFIALWTLLFIIPGIYKSYQYRMVPYIMTETPELGYKEALQRSKDMMQGQKWNAFVLDLSFIPWFLLSIITCGIVEVFYVAPYKNLTDAALYQKLRADGQCMEIQQNEI